jgi:hypothetical protein
LVILAEAEIATLNERDEHLKFKAANSLIHYLARLKESENASSVPMGTKKGMQNDLDMIARLRKPSKKVNGKGSGQLLFDAESRKLFGIIGMPIPLSLSEVPETLRVLHEMVTPGKVSEPLPDEIQRSSNDSSKSA